MQGWKMRDMKMRDQIAGVETAGKVSMESQSVKKCLKVVVFVCRVILSVYTHITTNNLEVRQGRLKMRDMKIRDGQKCRGGKCET